MPGDIATVREGTTVGRGVNILNRTDATTEKDSAPNINSAEAEKWGFRPLAAESHRGGPEP